MTSPPVDRRYYRWRQMSEQEREVVLSERKQRNQPWHSPPHLDNDSGLYLVTATCFEHSSIIGASVGRMSAFSDILRTTLSQEPVSQFAWVVLPNHYHAVVRAPSSRGLIRTLGQMHGRTSRQWNLEDGTAGRQVWFNAMERGIRSERHFWASVLYVFNNPVKHRYVERWQEWPFSNAIEWLDAVGRERAIRLWKDFPIDDYGREWDPPDL
jgi:putative transposase